MKNQMMSRMLPGAVVAGMLLLVTGCSGPSEDVRVSLCKNLTQSLQASPQSIEWKGNEYTFNRPAYAITTLTFDVVSGDGKRTTMTSACHFAYEALDDTAITLANPIEAYGTLPFAMVVEGRALSDGELLRLVNAEQKRQGRQVISTLEKNARDLAEQVRAGIGG